MDDERDLSVALKLSIEEALDHVEGLVDAATSQIHGVGRGLGLDLFPPRG